MRATQIIQRQFEEDLPQVHLARMRVVFAAVFTLLRCGQLSLTALGRAIAERTTHKHGIKRIDRLLGNPLLHAELIGFYRAIARRIIVAGSRPLIIVDWTAVTPHLWALVAAVSFQGRALAIYAETHPISRYLKPYVNAGFLRRVSKVLPRGCTPIIVADAGFRSPFMKLVRKMGWDYVVRLRGPANIRSKYHREWTKLPFLFGLTGTRPKDFGVVEIGERVRYRTRLVGVRQSVRSFRYHARVRHVALVWRHKCAAMQPWMLATSLDVSPARVIGIYGKRMQIEETFRDSKNTRFGMSLSHANTKSSKRADVLMLLAALAHVLAMLLGIAAEAAHIARNYQANTLKTKRVLSLAMLGRLVVASGRDLFLARALAPPRWSALRFRVFEGSVY